jgi:hypothetical protein
MYVDGTIGVCTALMFESFTEEPEMRGYPFTRKMIFTSLRGERSFFRRLLEKV